MALVPCSSLKLLAFLIFFVTVIIRINVESKAEYVQPLVMGMQVAIPYDIANIWNRPVSLGPVISTFLGLSLLYILFFGVITAPFGYMFGVPSQKYVLGTSGPDSLMSVVLNNAEAWRNYTLTKEAEENKTESETTTPDPDIPRSFGDTFVKRILRSILKFQWDYPDFSERVFRFMPNDVVDDESCQQLILCHAHNALLTLPDVTMTAYRVFSKTLTNVPKSHREAVKLGLIGANCGDAFRECPSDIYSLALRIFLGGLPTWLRKSLILPKF